MKTYFELSNEEKQQLLDDAEVKLNISALAIEKDIWVCWILQQLFLLPLKMTFKGGTSLSKVFNLIHRFSEDIDITIDHANFRPTIDLSSTTKSQLKKISVQLKKELTKQVAEIISPHLTKQAGDTLPHQDINIEIDTSGEQLRFYYPSTLSYGNSYLREHVLLEFGIRNSTEPSENKTKTALAANTDEIALPEASVDVLSPIRTFWEKATLIHVECHRKRLSNTPERLSRHWYDLAALEKSWVGKEARNKINLLKDVILHKKAFYNASYTHYDDCLNNKFRLIPDELEAISLSKDYKAMCDAGLFSNTPPRFDDILQTLSSLEKWLNSGSIQ